MGRILRLSDVPETQTTAGRWQALNEPLAISTFGINAVAMEPGEEGNIEHDEAQTLHQEAYVVVSGRAGFEVGGERFEAGPGDVVAFGDPAEVRNFWAVEPGTRMVCVGAKPGAEDKYGEWIAKDAQ